MHPDYPFQIAVLLIWSVMGFVRIYHHGYSDALSPEKVTTKDEGVFRWLRIGLGLPLGLVMFAFFLYPPWVSWLQLELSPELRWVGVPLGLLGIAGLVWVHKHLKQNFTGTVHTRSGGALATTGPYAYVRHPMYIVFLLIFASFFLLTANWFLGLGSLVIVLFLMIQRTPIEEQKLLEKYGEEYEAYRKRVGKFVPKW